MRVLLFTGKGGVGKTTVAAATATHLAAQGRKALVVSTDAAHSLGDALGTDVADDVTDIDTGLSARQVHTQRAFERSWRGLQRYLLQLLAAAGADPVAAEEITVLPGAEEVLALLAVRDAVAAGRHDVVCVDCAPTAETLRLLALPEMLGWWLRRLFPTDRRFTSPLAPLLRRAGARSGVPMPDDGVLGAVDRLVADLAGVRALLTDPQVSTVRLVLTPEAVVLAEARRTVTALSLHGYRVDGVVANRVFPAAGDDPWRAGWVAAQGAQLAAARRDFAPLPVRTAPFAATEPVGLPALRALAAALYGRDDPAALGGGTDPLRVERSAEGFVLVLALPHARAAEVALTRHGDELAVTVDGGPRRLLMLPSALRRCTVTGARVADGALRVSFEPDPALWMHP